jgi:glycosyltransferase involved in cell wall biosynthesis
MIAGSDQDHMSGSFPPKVSIVLPTFNGSQFIRESIESCLNQTYPNLELIIVDDGSTEHTRDIIASYAEKDPRIVSLRHTTNQNLPAALNTGFEAAQGKYLTWISDDNLFRPQAIEQLVAALDTHPEAHIAYSDFTKMDASGKFIACVNADEKEGLVLENCIGPCFLYRDSVQKQLNGYDEALFLAEDYDFWLRASVDFFFMPLHQDLYLYRSHRNSLTTRYKDKIRNAKINALEKNLPNLRWAPKSLQAEAFINLAALHQVANHRRGAWRNVRRALALDPKILLTSKALGLSIFICFGNRVFDALKKLYSDTR